MKEKLLTLALLATSLALTAQDVSKYTPGSLPEGVVYFLPKTLVRVTVTATQNTYVPGEFCQYADRYLHAKDVSAQPSVTWELNDVSVDVVGVPDNNKAFAVKVREKFDTSSVRLTDDGIVVAINTDPEPSAEKASDTPTAPTTQAKLDPHSIMTQDMLMAGSKAKVAELVAQEIYTIRESKNSLVRGQADYMPQDGTALKLMLDNLEKQERALTEMFTGTIDKQTKTQEILIDPNGADANGVVFRFSRKLGVLGKDNLAGKPYHIAIKNLDTLPPVDEGAMAKKKKEEGVIYNIPGKASVSVVSDNKPVCETETYLTQFGQTEVLSTSLFNQKVNTRVVFNPTNGSIVKIDKDQ